MSVESNNSVRKRLLSRKQSQGDDSENGAVIVVQKSLKLASYGMLIQLSWRAMSFTINGILLRYVSAAMLGVANVRLALLHNTLQFLSKEPFRRACLGNKTPANWRSFVNLLWLTVPIYCFWSCLLVPIWLFLLSRPNDDEIPYYTEATLLHVFGGFVEILCEPLWVISQLRMCVRFRVIVEGGAVFIKSLVLIFTVALFPSLGLRSFGWAQVFTSSFIAVCFWIHLLNYLTNPKDESPLHKLTDYFPSFSKNGIDWNLVNLIRSFLAQSVLKQLLTEGERYVMSFFNLLDFSEQGIYDVVNNLGSLVARFIFQPLEDSAYLLFSQTLSRGKPSSEQDSAQLTAAHQYLCQTLRFVSLVGAIIFCFGQGYASTALYIYGGDLLAGPNSSGPLLLRAFTVYVLFIAWNGLTESFTFSLMSEKELNRHNYRFLCFSFIFVVVAVLMVTYLGAVGFIIANSVNMLLRIQFNCRYIHKLFQQVKTMENPLRFMIPSGIVILSLACSLAVILFSQSLQLNLYDWSSIFWHIGVGFACLSGVASIVAISEKECIKFFAYNIFFR